jgi:hypothetical protein
MATKNTKNIDTSDQIDRISLIFGIKNITTSTF